MVRKLGIVAVAVLAVAAVPSASATEIDGRPEVTLSWRARTAFIGPVTHWIDGYPVTYTGRSAELPAWNHTPLWVPGKIGYSAACQAATAPLPDTHLVVRCYLRSVASGKVYDSIPATFTAERQGPGHALTEYVIVAPENELVELCMDARVMRGYVGLIGPLVCKRVQ